MTNDDAKAIEAIGRRLCWWLAGAGVLGLAQGFGVGWALYRLGVAASRAYGAP